MTKTKHFARLSALLATTAIAASLIAAAPANAGSIENLERERALLLETLLVPDLSPDERQTKLATSKRRLVDLERIVLRDDSLTGRNTPEIRTAFANYDLTFLVHAATEKRLLVVDNWFNSIGLTTQTLLSAKMGPR